MEEWKDIPGYEGLYLVSSLGRIFGCKREQYLSSPPLKSGYCQVGLSKEGKVKVWRVHTLVAMAFLGKKPRGSIVRHLDDIGEHNRVSNLAYGTRYDNLLDRHRLGRTGRPPASTAQKVEALRLVATGRTQKEAANILGIAEDAVGRMCRLVKRSSMR